MSSEDKHTLIASPEFLKRIVLAYEPILPKDSWYSIAGVVFSVLNLPEDVARVGEFVTTEHNNNGEERSLPQKKDQGASLRIRKMKEALLKSMVVVGLPRTINSISALHQVSKSKMLSPRDSWAPRSGHLDQLTVQSLIDRGETFFDQLYGKISSKVQSNLLDSYVDLKTVAILAGYGIVLSGDDFKLLSPAETSSVLIAGLIPQDVNPQLKGHLKGGLNNGLSKSEVAGVRSMVLDICGAAGVMWKEPVAHL